MPRVLNKRRDGVPNGAVYIGRPTKWGNPFVVGQDGDRQAVVQKYMDFVMSSPTLLEALPELRGKDLVCWCSPQACHGDVLLKLANARSE